MIPPAIFEDIKRILAERRSGTILFHVKDGAILGAEWQAKRKLGLICSNEPAKLDGTLKECLP